MTIFEFGPSAVSLEVLAAEAARVADSAVERVLGDYRRKAAVGEAEEEPALTGRIAQAIGDAFFYQQIEGVQFTSTVLKASGGMGPNEAMIGADILIHVRIEAPDAIVSKGILIQGKRKEKFALLSAQELRRLEKQCGRMLLISEDSYILNYSTAGLGCGSAREWQNNKGRDLSEVCKQSGVDFFSEFFGCKIGDRRITSSRVGELRVPYKVEITATGDIVGII